MWHNLPKNNSLSNNKLKGEEAFHVAWRVSAWSQLEPWFMSRRLTHNPPDRLAISCVRKNTNLIHTAKKAMDRNYLFMNNSENHEQRTPGGTVPLSLLESFNSHFPLKTFDYLLLRCFLWKSINTDGTIGLQSLLTSCNSTNLEAHIINILHTHRTSQKFHPRTDIVINLPVIIWKYSEVLSSVVKKKKNLSRDGNTQVWIINILNDHRNAFYKNKYRQKGCPHLDKLKITFECFVVQWHLSSAHSWSSCSFWAPNANQSHV